MFTVMCECILPLHVQFNFLIEHEEAFCVGLLCATHFSSANHWEEKKNLCPVIVVWSALSN